MSQKTDTDSDNLSKRFRLKRRRANKSSEDNSQNDSMAFLNSELLNFITATVKNNESFDFRKTGIIYTDAVAMIKESCENSSFCDSDRFSEYKAELEYSVKTPIEHYSKVHEENNPYSDCFIALSSVFATNPLTKRRNSLTSLLEQEFCFPDDNQKATYVYINVRDVIKSKGNAVFGPKREDIGIYNRKLYDSFTKEVKESCVDRPILNLKFFNFPQFAGNKDKILFADFVFCCAFDGSERRVCGDFYMVIHQNGESAVASVFNYSHTLFFSKRSDSFKSYLYKNKKKIISFYIEKFSMFEFEFICEQASLDAFNVFFKESAAALPPPIFGIEDFSNFL